MTALNKQALREAANAANIASWGQWESYKSHKGARGYEVKVGAKAVAQHCLKVDSAFIAAANPPTVLALLDENLQLQRDKDSLEAVAIAMRDDMRDAREKLEAAENRIAELETREVMLPTPYPKGYGLAADKYNFALEECADAIRAAGIGVKQLS
ncbi:ead/Ea22-like family protein [Citrobacter portucalensis]|uniref:ead/Ea22-like family protein n=1 Tax=Citrobacter portucalensis TaxID=1639133 RepID=UPI00339D42AB